MQSSYTLSTPINYDVQNDRTDKSVFSAISLIKKAYDVKIKHENECFLIQNLFENGFEIVEPTGARKITSQLIQQAIWRTANKMKPLDVEILGEGVDSDLEQLVTAGVSTILDRGGFARCMRDKGGAFQKLLLYGDAFTMMGIDTGSKFPVNFKSVSISNIYVDPFATSIRNAGDFNNAKEFLVIFSTSWENYVSMYPEMKHKAGAGKIPRDTGYLKELERDYYQTYQLSDTITEYGYYFHLPSKTMVEFVGSACTIRRKLQGKSFPFMKDGEPFIPVSQWVCMPSSEGFYNSGLGNILYRLAFVMQRLMNMGIAHTEDNTYPFVLTNVPKDRATQLLNDIRNAGEQRAAGGKGWIPWGYDPMNPAGSQVTLTPLTSAALIQEWQILFDRLDKEVKRLGINLDDVAYDQNVTATQVLAENENSDSWVKQIMEYNATETQFIYEATIDIIKNTIPSDDKTPINLVHFIELQNGNKKRVENITLGDVADELRRNYYFVKVNARTGAIPSNVLRQAQIAKMLQVIPPGSPAYMKLVREMGELNGHNIDVNDLGMSSPQQANGQQTPIPSETDKLDINPRSSQRVPAI